MYGFSAVAKSPASIIIRDCLNKSNLTSGENRLIMGTFTLSSRQVRKIEEAVVRNGGGIRDIKWLCLGKNFQHVIDLTRAEKNKYVPMSNARIAELTELAAKQGARIHILRRVKVKQDRDWQEAISFAGRNTSDDYVRKPEVSAQYQPVSSEVVEKDIVLLNYPNGDGWDKALAWGDDAKLKRTVPRESFAIGEQHPTLHKTLRQNPIYVVATTKCTFERYHSACYVCWDGSEREADLHWVSSFDDSHDWFSFSE